MFLLVNLVICVVAGVSMYRIVDTYNRKTGDLSLEPAASGVATAMIAAVAAPYIFYRMKGPVGVVYGLAFAFGMISSGTVLATIITVALN